MPFAAIIIVNILKINMASGSSTPVIGSGTGPNKIVEFLGYPMEQQYKTLLIDLLVASVVIALIILPSICCQVSGPLMKPKDSWEDIIERHR